MEVGEVVSNMEKAVTVSAQNTGFQCVHCGKILSEEARRKHVKHVHDKIREHICEICAKAFFSSSDLNKHRGSQTEEKNLEELDLSANQLQMINGEMMANSFNTMNSVTLLDSGITMNQVGQVENK